MQPHDACNINNRRIGQSVENGDRDWYELSERAKSIILLNLLDGVLIEREMLMWLPFNLLWE